MKDNRKPEFEHSYQSVNELAEKMFIAKFANTDINTYDETERLWNNCVHNASYIYFHFNDIINEVNKPKFIKWEDEKYYK